MSNVKLGDFVKFTLGPNGDKLFFGTITHMNKNGTFILSPEKPGLIPNNVKFCNIAPVTPVEKK